MTETPSLSQFDRVRGTFQPTRTDDLKLGCAALIGKTFDMEVLWIMGGEDRRPGEAALAWKGMRPFPGTDVIWLAESDFEGLELIGDARP